MELSDHITQVAAALVLIVALVIGLGWLVKRLNHGRLAGAGDIRIVASTFLGPKEKVLLLEVNNKQVLIGVNAASITALSEFAVDESASENRSFHNVLAEAKS